MPVNDNHAAPSDDVVDNVADKPVAGSMGIKGFFWNNVAQLTATTILSGAFLYLGHEFVIQSREKDTMFREELKAMRTQQETRWEKTDASHGREMEKMGATVEKAVDSLGEAVREMKAATEELKKVRVMGTVKGPS